MKLGFLSFALLAIYSSSSFFNNDSIDNTEYWTYCDSYTFKYLSLSSKGTFKWHYDSCKGDLELSGDYVYKGDTLYLIDHKRKKELKMLLRNNRLYRYNETEGKYSRFGSLIKTSESSNKRAYRKCARLRRLKEI